MMRNIAGSVFRFGWAMGMLGVDQAANLLDRERGWRRSTDSLDAISSAATEHLGPTARRLFEAGDHFQSGLIESAVHAARGMSGEGTRGLDEARERLGETFDTLRRDLREPPRVAAREGRFRKGFGAVDWREDLDEDLGDDVESTEAEGSDPGEPKTR